MTRDDILKIVEEQKINFFRMQFVDINGFQKNVAIPRSQLEKALDGGIMFDGSSIDGFARIICDVHLPDGTPYVGCPRIALKKSLAVAAEMGYTMNIGTEAEFFLFERDEDGNSTTLTNDNAGYFALDPEDRGSDCRREIIETLEEMGFEIEASHHEVAEGQHEVNFKFSDALTACDNTVTFKWVVKAVAMRYGYHATFMPKPIFGINGSGMHCNQSLFNQDGSNAFEDTSDAGGLSKVAYQYIAGVIKNARGFSAITNPLVNSYKRLVPGYEAPVYVAWSASNRSALVRIPASRGLGTRVEIRCPDPTCNPYLAIAMMLNSGLDGIKNNLDVPDSVDKDIFAMTQAEKDEVGIASMPGSLREALDVMIANPIAKETLGDHIFEKYVAIKSAEWDAFRVAVTDWELDMYLDLY
ncbi:MAG: type I glutamate--ammonia ligase [Spirochaetales bacterium]|jgi:glutamine synthetase|nr:type I glutamate--ammonia ligase [Spirochaetales bacterium]